MDFSHSSMNISESQNNTSVAFKNTFLEEFTAHWMYKAGNAIDKWWFLFLIPIGLIGNTLSMAVMAMKHNRTLSTCTYMMAIGINDNILMLIFLYQWLIKNTNIQTLTDTICRTVGPFITFFVYNGSYQVVLMTFDKCFAIKFPHKASVVCTPKRAKILLTIFFVCIFIFNSPQFYLTRLVVADCAGNWLQTPLAQAYVYLSFVITGAIPFCSLIVMNLIIVRAVRRSRKMRAQSEAGNSNSNDAFKVGNKMKQVESQLTMMSVIIAATYLVLFLPSHIRYILYQFVQNDATPATYAGFYFFVHLSFRLYATNYGIHFFLYLVSGTKFRNDLKKLFCKWGGKPDAYSVSNSNTSATMASELSVSKGVLRQ